MTTFKGHKRQSRLQEWMQRIHAWARSFDDDGETTSASDVQVALQQLLAQERGMADFSEKFRYAIATSHLLAPTLSISSYGKRSCTGVSEASCGMTFQAAREYVSVPALCRVRTRVTGRLPWRPLCVAALVILTALWAGASLPPVLLCLVAADAMFVRFYPTNHWDWLTQDIQFHTTQAPSSSAPFLATSVPHPAWVTGERIRLQVALMHQAQKLVRAAQHLDQSMNDILAAVQEVELVSRGYQLSRPMPPISRIEQASSSFYLDQSGVASRTTHPPQRLISLRKAMAESLDEATFHFRSATEKLAPFCDDDNLRLHLGLASVRHKPLGEETSSASPRPVSRRPLSLHAMATPPRFTSDRSFPERLSTGTPISCPHTPGLESQPVLKISEPTKGSTKWSPDSSSTHADTRDRLMLTKLRLQFEEMHAVRQTMLYHLLALDLSMRLDITEVSSVVTVKFPAYWEQVVYEHVLYPLTHIMESKAKKLEHLLEKDMSFDHIPAPNSLSPPSYEGFSDRAAEMNNILRTLKSKLRMCADELQWESPQLHGQVPDASSRPSGHSTVHAMLESMRQDLLSLSSEWEAALKITDKSSCLQTRPVEPAPTHLSEPAASPELPDNEHSAWSDKSEHDGQHESVPLWNDTTSMYISPADLPQPGGTEEVYQADPRPEPAMPTPSKLTRAERIRQIKEQRAQAPQKSTVSPMTDSLDVVQELRSVLQSRVHTAPAPEPTASTRSR